MHGRRLDVADDLYRLERRQATQDVGRPLREQPVEHDAERVDVRSGGDPLAADLLGAGVVRREGVMPRLGQARRRGAVGGEQRGDAEVEQLGVTGGGDQDVGRLDVAVDHQALVGIRERGAHLLHQSDAGADAGRVRLAPRVDRLAVDQLHDQVGHAVVCAAGIEQLGDARMIEAGEHAPLEAEAFDDRGRAPRRQDLDRGLPVELVVVALRREDDAHAAAADFRHQPEGAEAPADQCRGEDVGDGVAGGSGAIERGSLSQARSVVVTAARVVSSLRASSQASRSAPAAAASSNSALTRAHRPEIIARTRHWDALARHWRTP